MDPTKQSDGTRIDPLVPRFTLVAPAAFIGSREILEQAVKEQADRSQCYDAPAGERSMAKTVAAFNAIHGTQLSEVQGWQFMELLKMVRSTQGKPRLDNYVDGASYAALAGEAAMKGAA